MQCSAIKSRVGGKVELFGRSPLLRDRLGISLLVRGAEWFSLHHFFPSSFLNLLNCFYLDPWVFSLLLFLFIPPPHLMGSKQAAVWCLASCCRQPTTVISKRAGKKVCGTQAIFNLHKNVITFSISSIAHKCPCCPSEVSIAEITFNTALKTNTPRLYIPTQGSWSKANFINLKSEKEFLLYFSPYWWMLTFWVNPPVFHATQSQYWRLKDVCIFPSPSQAAQHPPIA